MKKEELMLVPVFSAEGKDPGTILDGIFLAFLQEKLAALESEEEKYV